MNKKELPSIRDKERSLRLLRTVLLLNKGLRCIGLGSRAVAVQEGELLSLQSQLHEFKTIPARFNEHFSSRGWIAHDSMHFELMKGAVQKADVEGVDKAEEGLFDDYQPEALRSRLVRLTATPQMRRRYRFIEFAFTDYAEGRYYSTIPLLLMIIDGSVNNILGKGFHTENACMDVWDAITGIDGGIENIKGIFRKGRFKTTEEQIDLSYRNGILHGIDLGYDNPKVAAKCWHFLFVVNDWILSKQSEDDRIARYEKDKTRHPSGISCAKLRKKEKHAIETWTPRRIAKDYLDSVATNASSDELLPETALISFLTEELRSHG